ncbi:PQQ-dependent sugar dehydrogenase [Cellvibrio mixtus]|uniref:PQQ-dependent sugar dehydrogenase n=1 Tax=Cellvibrio mixtus TaxID=39650 RepID=UPI000694D383|nr:sorbosone dehydrogenase family protein [Cellvibrio mixtus]
MNFINKIPAKKIVVGIALSLGAISVFAQSSGSSSSFAGYGINPVLTAPEKKLLPVVNVAPAKGWPEKTLPTPTHGTKVGIFAKDLQHPRWLYLLPNGDVLVAETNAPPRENKGFRAWVTSLFMKKAGSTGESANRITLLRDTDNDGVADFRSPLLEGLHSPFGMALVGSNLYIANTDAIVHFDYRLGDTKITSPGTRLVDLPGGPINHHWTKNIIASADGSMLYATVGSNSNVGEAGMAAEEDRAAILAIEIRTGKREVFASGLRNPNGLAWHPVTGELWTVVNERDELGNDLVPDYLTSVKKGGFYGWPYSYFGQHIDERVKPQQPELVRRAIVPDYALGAHTASLGLAWSEGNSLPAQFANGMFIGQHGSWNRKPHSGYKVVFIPFANGKPSGAPPVDVLTDFLSKDGDALGRPVGVILDNKGALLVADDVGNIIWRVSSASP